MVQGDNKTASTITAQSTIKAQLLSRDYDKASTNELCIATVYDVRKGIIEDLGVNVCPHVVEAIMLKTELLICGDVDYFACIKKASPK